MTKLALPMMGNYQIPGIYLLKKILKCEVIKTPKITKKTLELGTKYSPETVCMPFKYTLGAFIEAINSGADTVVQFGGGCRYGYYYELQENILKDLYDVNYINLVSKGKTNIKEILKKFKSINPKLSLINALYRFLITKRMVFCMDKIEDYMRHNLAFEKEKEMQKIYNELLNKFENNKGYINLIYNYLKYFRKIKKVKLDKPENRIRIGIIGELFTVMEPFGNNDLEELLIKNKVDITRFTNVKYLLFEKGKKIKKYLKYSKEFVKYRMGADASDNIARTKYLCENKYDAIIHIKSTFCTPEIGAMPIIEKICNEYKVPILFFSFDSQDSKTGFYTRVEALLDMIEMRKKNE